jgi:hypothetical protein
LLSCEQHSDKEFDRLASAYAEILILNERYNSPTDTLSKSTYNTQREEILKKYGFSAEEFQNEMKIIFNTPEKAKQFFPVLQKKLQ